MRTYCCNFLIVPKTILPTIVRKYVGRNDKGREILDFEAIEPIGDGPDIYERRNEKWGTKLVGCDLSIGTESIEFYTTWTPPVPIIRKLAELHKDYEFRLEYFDTHMTFSGIATAKWKDGDVFYKDRYRDMTEEELRSWSCFNH